ncbi:hypothetical protein ACFVAV_33430 [Nocardia sp. NPDC057663]|uniref:hypothetical protein n=1 Tax=Nocardia sp. NPDC057663 TaxID=3346201 RepID=UPI00366C5C0B
MINVEYLDNSHAARFVGYMGNEINGRPPQGHVGSDSTSTADITRDAAEQQHPVHPVTAEDVARAIQAAEDAARLLQEVEAAVRRQQARAFTAGFAGSSLGRLLGKAGEKLLDKLDWFGLA